MPLIKFIHGGKEHTFSGEDSTTDLANFIAKENFGFTLVEMAQRLVGFTFEYDDIQCYFSPTFIVKSLAPAQVKADVQNLIQDLQYLVDKFGFDKCPACNVVYPNTKVEHCKKCGYTPPELQEAKRKLLEQIDAQQTEAGDGEDQGPSGDDRSGEVIPESGDQAEGGDQGGDVLPQPGGLPNE